MTVEEAEKLPISLAACPVLFSHLQKIKNEAQRRRSRAAYALLRTLCLSHGCIFRELPSDPLRVLDFTESGKPVLAVAGAPFISLSHGGGYVAAAISERPVGIDIEPLSDRPKDIDAFVKRFFPRCEWTLISEAEPDKRKAFLSLYTKKEAVLKAIGGSLAAVMRMPLNAVPAICETSFFKDSGKEYCLALAEAKKEGM